VKRPTILIENITHSEIPVLRGTAMALVNWIKELEARLASQTNVASTPKSKQASVSVAHVMRSLPPKPIIVEPLDRMRLSPPEIGVAGWAALIMWVDSYQKWYDENMGGNDA